MLLLKKYSDAEIEEVNVKKFFPDISAELKKIIDENKELKKDIIRYISFDKAGLQYNSVRICKVPDSPEKLESEVDDLEAEIAICLEDGDNETKLTAKRKELYKKKKELKKLKNPYKYLDNICESYLICPLAKKGKNMNGEPCPYERFYVEQQTETYLKEFELDISKQSIDKTILTQLVLSDLMIYRCTRALASTSLISISEKKNEFGSEFTTNLNQYIVIREKELKNRERLLSSMLGTRESHRKYKVEKVKNSKQKASDERVAEIIRNNEKISTNKVPNLVLKEDIIVEAEIV